MILARRTPDTTRRPGIPCRPIVLADGAEWCFLRPSIRLCPRVVVETDSMGGRVERVAVDVNYGYSMLIESLIGDLNEACDHSGIVEQYDAFFALAAELLLQVHDISLQTVCGLLAVGEENLFHLVSEVISVISYPVDPTATNSSEALRREPS